MSSETKEGIDLYIKNYDGYDLNNVIKDLIKNDFLKFKSKMNKLESKNFLRDAYYIRTGITDIATMNIYGSSVFNPMYNINFLETSLIVKYNENNVLGNLGITYDKFKGMTKLEQNNIIEVLKNINLHKTTDVNNVLNEINNKDGEL